MSQDKNGNSITVGDIVTISGKVTFVSGNSIVVVTDGLKTSISLSPLDVVKQDREKQGPDKPPRP